MAVLAVHRRTSPAARATTWPTMASWRRYDAPPTNLQRLMYGLLLTLCSTAPPAACETARFC